MANLKRFCNVWFDEIVIIYVAHDITNTFALYGAPEEEDSTIKISAMSYYNAMLHFRISWRSFQRFSILNFVSNIINISSDHILNYNFCMSINKILHQVILYCPPCRCR